MKRFVVLAAVAAVLSGGQPAAAQEVPQATITDDDRRELNELVVFYLDRVEQHMGLGMPRAAGLNDEIVDLQPNADHRWEISLDRGVAYRIVGACDNECSNMDMELIDARTGAVVLSDTLPDDYPTLSYTPAANGRYVVRIIMRACSIAPCFAGARVLARAL